MAEKKAPDATALQKISNSIAAMFGRAAGADDATIAALEIPVEKSAEVPAEIVTRLAKAEADATALTARLAKSEEETSKLREEATLRKFAEEVTGYAGIGLDPTKDAALLKSVEEKCGKEAADRLREVFKAQLAQKAASSLMREIGTTGVSNAPGSAAEDVEQRSAALVQKNDKLSLSQARDQVFRENPSLYEKWREETTVKV